MSDRRWNWNNLKIGEGIARRNAVVLPSGEFHGSNFPRALSRIPGAWSRTTGLHRRCAGLRRCASLRAVCVAIPYLSLHLCNPRFIADDYARMEVRAAGGRGGGRRRWALAHGYRTAAIDWRDRDVVLDVSLLSMPNTVLYLLVEERISLRAARHFFLRRSSSLFLSREIGSRTVEKMGTRENVFTSFVFLLSRP